MNRRLYFLLPDKAHALSVVNEVAGSGIDIEEIHALADKKIDLGGLPQATSRQSNDAARRIETILWNGNLILFGLALGIFIMLLGTRGLTVWLLPPLGIMLAAFIAGLNFTRVPNTHLQEFHHALAHGEILLMIDVPENRVADIEHRVHQHHPEAAIGGVGWGARAFGL